MGRVRARAGAHASRATHHTHHTAPEPASETASGCVDIDTGTHHTHHTPTGAATTLDTDTTSNALRASARVSRVGRPSVTNDAWRRPGAAVYFAHLAPRITTLSSQPATFRERAEKHAQNLMMGLCLLFISNTLITVRDIDKGMSAIGPRIDALEVQVALAYRESDARRDLAAIRGQIDLLSGRLAALEASQRVPH